FLNLRLAIRQILKLKIFSIINLVGLSILLAAGIVILPMRGVSTAIYLRLTNHTGSSPPLEMGNSGHVHLPAFQMHSPTDRRLRA
ncbi:hypothetical protein ACFLSP_03265, partial [Bacteroidota bacterium]